MLNLLSKILMIISIVLNSISIFLLNDKILFIAFHIMWISNLIYSISFIKKRFIFAVFNATFFLFVMGRLSMNYLFYGTYGLNYSNDIIYKVFTIIMFALLSIRVFYILLEKHITIKSNNSIKKVYIGVENGEKINRKALKHACKVIYWITYAFTIIYIMERVVFVQQTSYANYYVNFSTSLPSIFAKMYTVNEISFFMFLATNPRKKEVIMPGISFLLIGIISLGYGQRNPIALRFCILILIYIPLREYFRKSGEEKWVTRKYKISILITIPIIIFFFSFWGSYRLSQNQNFDIAKLIVDFFDTQGNSAKILAETIDKFEKFPDNRWYTFGPLVDFTTNNFIYKAIFGNGAYYSAFTEAGALKGWNFGSTISYLYSPYHYFNGVGLGSCYLAEVFKDFGYIGITIISSIYSFIMTYAMKKYSKNYYVSGVILIFLYEVIYAPRDCALSFLAKVFSFTFIMAIAMIYVVYKFLKLKMIKKGGKLQDEYF